MIESLRISKSKFLALFAVSTSGIGFAVGVMVQLFHGTARMNSGSGQVSEWGRELLEMNAAAAAGRVEYVCILLEILSFFVLAVAYINESQGNDPGLVRFSARTLYVLSFIAVVAAICAAVFFIICHM